ncbi:amidohydrolase family protein [Sphingomonas sp. CD22]|uniref:amidohydrolase family protein n=1 Tax=Sphingomonas sp. CD22 TaxID=3100214 RepID=UPI002AE01A31|nr:amidohydrolase family protein [Sphingomonas sp. CD22]MEA1086155.1 amidohydrolase family protein [Sphingomonas sp. CD22]
MAIGTAGGITIAGVVDAHHHLWRLDWPGHQWPDASLPAIHRDFAIADLRADSRGTDLAATVLVQSQPTDADTDRLCAIAAAEPLVGALVGWADLAAADAPRRIADLAARPKLRGLRPMLQSIADTDWMLQPALDGAIAAMIAHGLRFDALVQPRHLRALHRFAQRWPDLPIVIDHAAKPGAAAGGLDPWRAEIAALAALDNVWCKMSGLRTEQPLGEPATALAPYVAHLVGCFGERLMWGSDWPVLHLSGDGYAGWFETARTLAGLDPAGERSLFADSARRFYGLP